MLQLGIEPTTQVCTLTGNQTCNLLVNGMMPQPTEPPAWVINILVLIFCEYMYAFLLKTLGMVWNYWLIEYTYFSFSKCCQTF